MKQEGTQKYSGGGTEISNIKDTPELGSSPLGSPPQTQRRSWSDHNLFSSRNAPAPFSVLVSATCWAVRAQLCPSLGTFVGRRHEPSALIAHLTPLAVLRRQLLGRADLWQESRASGNTHCSLLSSLPLLTKFPDTSGGLDLMHSLALEHRNYSELSTSPRGSAITFCSYSNVCPIPCRSILKLRTLQCNTRIPPIVTVIMWLKLMLVTLIFGAVVLGWTFRTKNSETNVSW